jgi:hypothetical protein
MSIVKIIGRTIILVVCGIIQIIAIVIDGVSKLIGKLGEYLFDLHDWLMERLNKKVKIKKTAIDIPL